MDVLMHPEFGKKVVVRPINATPEMYEIAHKFLKSNGYIHSGDPNTEEAKESRGKFIRKFYKDGFGYITARPSMVDNHEYHDINTIIISHNYKFRGTETTHPVFHQVLKDYMLGIIPHLKSRVAIHTHLNHLDTMFEPNFGSANNVALTHTPIHEQRSILSLYKNFLLHPDTEKDNVDHEIGTFADRSHPTIISNTLALNNNNAEYVHSHAHSLIHAMSDEGVRKDMHALLDHAETKGGLHTLMAKSLRYKMASSYNAHPFEIKDALTKLVTKPHEIINMPNSPLYDSHQETRFHMRGYRNPSDPLYEQIKTHDPNDSIGKLFYNQYDASSRARYSKEDVVDIASHVKKLKKINDDSIPTAFSHNKADLGETLRALQDKTINDLAERIAKDDGARLHDRLMIRGNKESPTTHDYQRRADALISVHDLAKRM